MKPIRLRICDKCGKFFERDENDSPVCPKCRDVPEKEQQDLSIFEPVVVDLDEDEDYNEDPDYDEDETFEPEDDTDLFADGEEVDE